MTDLNIITLFGGGGKAPKGCAGPRQCILAWTEQGRIARE